MVVPFLAALVAATGLWVQHPGAVLTPTAAWEQTAVQEPSVRYDLQHRRFQMWYSGGADHCYMGYAVSRDGVRWARQTKTQVLGGGKGGEPYNVCHSNVQYINGRYYAWYSVDSLVRNGDLHQATSPDGLHWTALPTPAVKATEQQYATANSYVVRDGNHWLMFWESLIGDGHWVLFTATSPDLTTWRTDYRMVAGLGYGWTFGGPWITKNKDGWTMYYHAGNAQFNVPQAASLVFAATSPNLKDWTTQTQPLIRIEQPSWQVDQIADPTVATVNGRTLMWFDGLENGATPIRSSIGLAQLG